MSIETMASCEASYFWPSDRQLKLPCHEPYESDTSCFTILFPCFRVLFVSFLTILTGKSAHIS